MCVEWGKRRVGQTGRLGLMYRHYHCETDCSWEPAIKHRKLGWGLCFDLEGCGGVGWEGDSRRRGYM